MAMGGPRHGHDDEDNPSVFADINITPLTDIFLVLLIIFMVTTTAAVEAGQGGSGAGVRVDLPKGAARELKSELADFPIAIDHDGNIIIEGKVVDTAALRERLLKLRKDTPDAQVVINADTGVQHGHVVEVMEVAKAVGIERLAIATESAEGK